MKRFWTADIEFGAAGAADEKGYFSRPFRDVEHMNKRIISNANMRVKDGDTVVHVGDFCVYGKSKGIEGSRKKYDEYLKELKGRWVLMWGNHDNNNGTKTLGEHLFTRIGKYRVFVSHYPTYTDKYDLPLLNYVKGVCDFVICGHVHNKWAEKIVTGIVNINVGVDVRKFMPIDDNEIIHIYESFASENGLIKTSRQWCIDKGIDMASIHDPDGWDRSNFEYSFDKEKISHSEFRNRLSYSTRVDFGKKL